LFERCGDNPIITVEDIPFPVQSVFNPGAVLHEGEVILLLRVEDMRGFSCFVRARSADGVSGWRIDEEPVLKPEPERFPEEIWGVEDPRITYVPELGEYVVAYTAYSRGGPLVSLAKTRDLVRFEKLGAVFPPEDKDAALFPVRIRGKWAVIHRPLSGMKGIGGHMWISYSPDLLHWGDHRILIHAREGGWWDANKIGLSPPPMEIPEGWLVLYHGVRYTAGGVIYRLGLALLDREDPARVLRRSDEWIFGPREPYETYGDVDHVVFPCGWVVRDGMMYLYYGAADSCVGLATAPLEKVREYIMACPEADASPLRWA